MLTTMLTTFCTMVLMLAVGFFLGKKGIMTKDVTGKLSDILINVFLFCSIISSFIRPFDKGTAREILMMMLIATLYYLGASLLSGLVFRLLRYPSSKHGISVDGAVYQNVGFFGYPLCQSIYGADGLLFSVSYGMMYNPFQYVWGVWYLSRGKSKVSWRLFATPPVIACIIGAVIYFVGIPLPKVAVDTLNSLGACMTPTAMLILGAGLVGIDIKGVFDDWQAWPPVILRLLVFPLLMYVVLLPFPGISAMHRIIIVLLSALPSGSMNVILARKYGADVDFANKVLILSMIFCIPTMLLLMAFLPF